MHEETKLHEGTKLHEDNFARVTILHGGSFLHESKEKKLKYKLIKKETEKKVTDRG